MFLTNKKIVDGYQQNKVLKIVVTDCINQSTEMKHKVHNKKMNYQSDDDNVRYKLNDDYFKTEKLHISNTKKPLNSKTKLNEESEDNVRYMLPVTKPISKNKVQKDKLKPKIKVNFWSNRRPLNRIKSANKEKIDTQHTDHKNAIVASVRKPKIIKVRKKVSVFPSPLYSDNLVPMVTVPDDLTIQLNEDEVHDLSQELHVSNGDITSTNNAIPKNQNTKVNMTPNRKSRSSTTQTTPRNMKHRCTFDDFEAIAHNHDSDLEFFSKYVVQKLRKMETNQRIYSENLINTVLMIGQLGKLNGKWKVTETENNIQC